MKKSRILIVFAPLFCLLMISSLAQAAEVTNCAFDKESYYPGQTGYVAVTVYNDHDSTIRVYELTATIDYYYNDDNIYVQTFFSNPDPPTEIEQGESETLNIDFSLPANIASGYTTLLVRARTEIWDEHAQRWQWSDHPTYHPTLYIESPYKQQSEDQQATIHQLEGQLKDQQAINQNATTMIFILGAITLVFAAVLGLLLVILRRARAKFLSLSTA